VKSAAGERHRAVHSEIMLRVWLIRENRDLHTAQRWWVDDVRALVREAVTLSAGYSADVMEQVRSIQKRLHAAADHQAHPGARPLRAREARGASRPYHR